jgi:hypothetical protein
MKRIALILIALITLSVSYAQEESVTYKVTNLEINGTNYDDLALEGDEALAFYMCKKENFCFSNCWRNNDSQSYGGVYGLKETEIAETDSTYAAMEYKFTWKFRNTYDKESGAAAVTFTKIFINSTIKFTAEIIVIHNNEVLILKGYQE